MRSTPREIPAGTLPKRAWLTVGLLFFVVCSNYLARNMVPTMRTSLVRAIPMNDAQFGLLSSVFLWVYGLASPFAGYLSDRFSRTRVILISMLGWSVATVLTGYVDSFRGLLAMRVLMALSEVCYIPAGLALITDYHTGQTRARATGIHQAGMAAGAMLGGLGGWLADLHGWSYSFITIGGSSLAYCGILLIFLRDAPSESEAVLGVSDCRETPRFGTAVSSLFSNYSFILVLLGVSITGGVGWIIMGWLPTYFGEHFNLSQGYAGLSATGYFSGALMIGFLPAGIWSDRWSRTNLRSRVFVSVIGLAIATPALLITSISTTFTVAVVSLLACGFTRSLYDVNVMPMMCLVVDPRYRATAFGLINLASTLTGGILIFGVGALRDRKIPLEKCLFWGAAVQILCIALLLNVKPLSRFLVQQIYRDPAGRPLTRANWR